MDPDDLHCLSLERFVAERGALARTLRAEGRREEAVQLGMAAKKLGGGPPTPSKHARPAAAEPEARAQPELTARERVAAKLAERAEEREALCAAQAMGDADASLLAARAEADRVADADRRAQQRLANR